MKKVLLLAVLLAACGGSDPSSGGDCWAPDGGWAPDRVDACLPAPGTTGVRQVMDDGTKLYNVVCVPFAEMSGPTFDSVRESFKDDPEMDWQDPDGYCRTHSGRAFWVMGAWSRDPGAYQINLVCSADAGSCEQMFNDP